MSLPLPSETLEAKYNRETLTARRMPVKLLVNIDNNGETSLTLQPIRIPPMNFAALRVNDDCSENSVRQPPGDEAEDEVGEFVLREKLGMKSFLIAMSLVATQTPPLALVGT